MAEETYLEEKKRDASEMVQILKSIPENKKEGILMLVRGYALGLKNESVGRMSQ